MYLDHGPTEGDAPGPRRLDLARLLFLHDPPKEKDEVQVQYATVEAIFRRDDLGDDRHVVVSHQTFDIDVLELSGTCSLISLIHPSISPR